MQKKQGNKYDILELPLNFLNEAFCRAHVCFRGAQLPVASPYFVCCFPFSFKTILTSHYMQYVPIYGQLCLFEVSSIQVMLKKCRQFISEGSFVIF